MTTSGWAQIEPAVRAVLSQYPTMAAASVIAERAGWTRGHSWFPGQLVPDHAGVLRSFPVLVMVAAYSRFIAALMIPSRVTGDLLAGMWQLLVRSH